MYLGKTSKLWIFVVKNAGAFEYPKSTQVQANI